MEIWPGQNLVMVGARAITRTLWASESEAIHGENHFLAISLVSSPDFAVWNRHLKHVKGIKRHQSCLNFLPHFPSFDVIELLSHMFLYGFVAMFNLTTGIQFSGSFKEPWPRSSYIFPVMEVYQLVNHSKPLLGDGLWYHGIGGS